MNSVGIALYGDNGHQLVPDDLASLLAHITGVFACQRKDYTTLSTYASYEDLLHDPKVHLVSFCAPQRKEQGDLILQALHAGKHVYAEKPAVMDEIQLDLILQTAEQSELIFCEMANTFWEEPYATVRELIHSGSIGSPVQIFAQKSYPFANWRPQEETIDGGLLLQNAVYCFRFVLHVLGEKISHVQAVETTKGNPIQGDLRMAVSLQMELAQGGVVSAIANYLNQPSIGPWGNEQLRIFGENGIIETSPFEDTVTVYYPNSKEIHFPKPRNSLLALLIHSIQTKSPLPFSMEWLLEPTRMALRAKKNAILTTQKESRL